MLLSNFKRLGSGEKSRYGEVYSADMAEMTDDIEPDEIVQTQRVAVKYSPTIITLHQKLVAEAEDKRGESYSWTYEPLAKEVAHLTSITKSRVGRTIPNLPRLKWAGMSPYLGTGKQKTWNNHRLNQRFIPAPDPKHGVFTMVMELCHGSLTDWLKHQHIQNEWYSLVVQMLIALTAIEEEELRLYHSDAHMGNWLYIQQPESRAWRYIIEDEDGEHEIYLKTKYLWQLADFGMAERLKPTRLALLHMHRDVDKCIDHAIGERTEDELKQGMFDPALIERQRNEIYTASSTAALQCANVDERYVPAWETLKRLISTGSGRLFTKKQPSVKVANQDTPFYMQVKKIVLED